VILFPRSEMPNNISKPLAFGEHAVCITNTSIHSFGELVTRLQLSLLPFSLTKLSLIIYIRKYLNGLPFRHSAGAGELFASVLESASDRGEVVVLEDNEDIFCDSPHNMIEIKRGLAPEVKVSAPPADWVPDRIKLACAEPESFLVIDNHGGWGQYTFRPKFHNKAKGKDIQKEQYSHHALPTGARPVPADNEGKREKAGWAFHYKGWSNDDNANLRSGASCKNPSPDT
jgi:hypothetical protein